MTRHERQLKATQQEMERHSKDAQAIWTKADEEERETTPEERGEIEEHLRAIETLKEQKGELEEAIAVRRKAADISKEIGPAADEEEETHREIARPKRAKTLGEQFVESEGYKQLLTKVKQGGRFESLGQVELDTKTTLTELTGSGGQIIQPDVQAGIQETLYQPLTIADLMASGSTTSNTVRYVRETPGSAVNAAAAVAEAGTKPESTLQFDQVDEPVQKVATFLPVSEEMLEDVAQIQAYINQRLSLFVKITEEAELGSGSGTPPHLRGLTNRTGVNTYARGTVDSNAVALFKAANGGRGSSFLEPDAIVMNPANWQSIRLGTDSSGQFFGGGPFFGAYGGPQGPAGASQFSSDQIWGLPVHVTTAVGSGTAIVGAFRQGAQVYRRSGLSVDASNSHSNYFQLNLVAIRAEERLALAVYRPAAFTIVTGLS